MRIKERHAICQLTPLCIAPQHRSWLRENGFFSAIIIYLAFWHYLELFNFGNNQRLSNVWVMNQKIYLTFRGKRVIYIIPISQVSDFCNFWRSGKQEGSLKRGVGSSLLKVILKCLFFFLFCFEIVLLFATCLCKNCFSFSWIYNYFFFDKITLLVAEAKLFICVPSQICSHPTSQRPFTSIKTQ